MLPTEVKFDSVEIEHVKRPRDRNGVKYYVVLLSGGRPIARRGYNAIFDATACAKTCRENPVLGPEFYEVEK